MIAPHKKYKIALIGYRLGIGGAEKVMANLSLYFDQQGIEVHNIIVLDVITYDFAGTLVNLGKLKNASNGVFNKWKRFLYLKKYLNQHQFDFIIDFRFRLKPIQELLIAKILYTSETIYTVHSSKIDHYIPKGRFLAHRMYGKCFKIITISEKSKELIAKHYRFKNLQTIYNPLDLEAIQSQSQQKIELTFEYIIGIGQMDNPIKQLDQLIQAYSQSDLPNCNIHLVLLGEGIYKKRFQQLAKDLKIDDKVHFLGFQKNPFQYLKNAKFYVLTSLYEGLPYTLLESLACHTPVVAFDCLSGPSEMIQNQKNGLLVEDQNFQKLIEAMNRMIHDTALYDFCKQNASASVQKFSMQNIGKQWLELMKINI